MDRSKMDLALDEDNEKAANLLRPGDLSRLPPKSPLRSSVEAELKTNLEQMTEQVRPMLMYFETVKVISCS